MKKSGSGLLIPETRWRAREEAAAATAGPKRREGIVAEARHHEKRSKLARIHRTFKLLAEKSIDFDRRSGNDRRMQLAELDITKSGSGAISHVGTKKEQENTTFSCSFLSSYD
jgi:hypothetical protein